MVELKMMPDLGVIERIQERYDGLRKSEKLVANYIRDHSNQLLDMSITDFARTLGVSEATVSRFTRALGYKGYPEIKLALASELNVGNKYINIPGTMLETDSLIEVSRKLFGALSSSIGETQKSLNFGDIQEAVSHVLNAQKVIFFGVGGAAAVCDEAAHLLLKAGIQASAHRDGYSQLVQATTVNETFTVFGISHTGTTDTVARSLILAGEQGAKTIAITSDANSLVARSGACSLVTAKPDAPDVPLYGDYLEGRICQLYIIYLIYLGVLFQSGGEAQKCLDATAESLKKHYMRT